MNMKYVLMGLLLLIGTAFAFTISSSEPVKSVQKGDVAMFELTLAGQGNVDLSLNADIPSSISDRFVRVEGEETVYAVVYTDTVSPGFYGVQVLAEVDGEEYTYQLSVGVEENQDGNFKLNAVFDELELVQGEDAELRFILRNMDDQPIKNIIIKSDIFGTLEPEQPDYINLQPGETEDFEVKISVPRDFRTGDYTFTITAAAGNIEVREEVAIEVIKASDLSDDVTLSVSNSWEPIEDDTGAIIGYRIPFTVESDASTSLNDMEVVLTGTVSNWQLNGDEQFDLDAFEEKDLELEVFPENFDDTTAKMQIVYEEEILASRTISFAGYKVGAPTGFFFMGGSLTIGLLLIVVIALIVLYIRQKNITTEQVEDIKTKAYLKDLVEKTQDETSDKKTKRKKSK